MEAWNFYTCEVTVNGLGEITPDLEDYAKRTVEFEIGNVQSNIRIIPTPSKKTGFGKEVSLSVDAEWNGGKEGLTYTWLDEDGNTVQEESENFTYTLKVTKDRRLTCVVKASDGDEEVAECYAELDSDIVILNSLNEEDKIDVYAEAGDETKDLIINARSVQNHLLTYEWFDKQGETWSPIAENVNGNKLTVNNPLLDTTYKCVITSKGENGGEDETKEVFINLKVNNTFKADEYNDIYVAEGGTATLDIGANEIINHLNYHWSCYGQNSEKIQEAINDTENSKQGILTLSELEETGDDYDIVYCEVTDAYGHSKRIYFYIYVAKFKVKAKETFVKTQWGKDSFKLEAEAITDLEDLNWRWEKKISDEKYEAISEGVSVSEDKKTSALELNGKKWYDRKVYRCCAWVDGKEECYYSDDIYVYSELPMPENYTKVVTPGENVKLTVAEWIPEDAEGNWEYQWYRGSFEYGAIWLDATQNNYPLTDVREEMVYTCQVRGMIDGHEIHKDIEFKVVLENDLDVEGGGTIYINLGEKACLKVMSNTEGLKYHWHQNNGDIWNEELGDELSTDLTAKSIEVEKAGDYVCRVTDGNVWKKINFRVEVVNNFTVQRVETAYEAVKPGTEVKRSVKAKVTNGALSYQWIKEDTWEYLGKEPEISCTVEENLTLICEVSDDFGNTERITYFIGVLQGSQASKDNPVELKLGEPQWATIENPGTSMYFWFKPNQSGKYRFSNNYQDAPFTVMPDAGEEIIVDAEWNIDVWSYTFELEKDVKYIISTGFWDRYKAGSYKVSLTLVDENHVHDAGIWSVKTEATCDKDGVKVRKCGLCGEVLETAAIPAAGHTWGTPVISRAATCKADGERTYTCTVCGETRTESYQDPNAHDGGVWSERTAATCGKDGVKVRTCGLCGKELETAAIPATGAHTWGDYVVTKEATVFEEGIQTRTCSVCGSQESAAIPKLAAIGKVSATTLPMKRGQSTAALKVTDMAQGDYVKEWKSSKTSIVKVTGKANGTSTLKAQKKDGTAKITITLASGKVFNVTVKVQKGTVKTTKTAVSNVTKNKLTLEKGKSFTLKTVLTPLTSQEKVTYSSNKKAVATVSAKGVIKAKASGTAVITVKSGKKTVKVTVTVPGAATKKITGVKSAVTLKKGKTLALKPKLTPANSNEKITYSTSKKKVATVSAKGVIKAVGKGTAVITVKSGKVSVKCKVTVK